MPRSEAFTIPTPAGELRGVLHQPDDGSEGERRSTVLIYRGLHVERSDAGPMLDTLAEMLAAVGRVVITWEPRVAGMILEDFHAYSLADERADAGCVMRWLAARTDVAMEGLCVVAYAMGAMTGLWLAREHEQVSRLCLIAPASAKYVTERLEREHGSDGSMQELPTAYVQALRDSGEIGVEGARGEVLIVHGAADEFVPVDVAHEYDERFEHAGRSATLLLAARADHALSRRDMREVCLHHIVQFLAAQAVRS